MDCHCDGGNCKLLQLNPPHGALVMAVAPPVSSLDKIPTEEPMEEEEAVEDSLSS